MVLDDADDDTHLKLIMILYKVVNVGCKELLHYEDAPIII